MYSFYFGALKKALGTTGGSVKKPLIKKTYKLDSDIKYLESI